MAGIDNDNLMILALDLGDGGIEVLTRVKKNFQYGEGFNKIFPIPNPRFHPA